MFSQRDSGVASFTRNQFAGAFMHLSTFNSFFFYFSFSYCSNEKCQRFLSHFCAYLFWMCFAPAIEHNIYLITVDNWWAAFAINYGSVESLKEFFSCPLCCFAFRSRFLSSWIDFKLETSSISCLWNNCTNYKSNLNDIVVYFMEIVHQMI